MGPEAVPGHPTAGMHIWGWMSPVELEWLRNVAGTMRSVVEIGSLHGRSAFALLTGCTVDQTPPGVVYAIDLWDDEHRKSFPSFAGHTAQFTNVVAVKANSVDAARWLPDVDMVFIDGDHHYESVVADLDAWLPKTRRLICGHDYYDTDEWKVKQAVDERFGPDVRRAVQDPAIADLSAIWAVWL